MNIREYLIAEIHSLTVDQAITLEPGWRRHFPCGWPSMYTTSKDALMSNLIGSSWGVFRIHEDPMTGATTVTRHEESDKRHWVSPDREHHFTKDKDGYFVPISESR